MLLDWDILLKIVRVIWRIFTGFYFPRVLRVRRKNEEYAEIYFHFQQCLGTLKGQDCILKKLNELN
jgi:hypothetical protein